MMIRLPRGWQISVQLRRTPQILEEHWTDTALEAERLVDQLKHKYTVQHVQVRSQYMIEFNLVHIIVFEGAD